MTGYDTSTVAAWAGSMNALSSDSVASSRGSICFTRSATSIEAVAGRPAKSSSAWLMLYR